MCGCGDREQQLRGAVCSFLPLCAIGVNHASAHAAAPRPPVADREHSGRSGEGDTEQEGEGGNEGGGGHAGGHGGVQGDEHQSFRQGLLRHFHKQSSAANLTRMANPAELRRLQEELRWVGVAGWRLLPVAVGVGVGVGGRLRGV